jgi:hypothetical protein
MIMGGKKLGALEKTPKENKRIDSEEYDERQNLESFSYHIFGTNPKN